MEHLGELRAALLDQFLCALLGEDDVYTFKVYASHEVSFPAFHAIAVRLLVRTEFRLMPTSFNSAVVYCHVSTPHLA
jgi:hypothetical protein